MELLEVLDQIDATAPRTCQTCRHAGTHSACDGCLSGTRGEPFPYRNWEPGNWLRELHAAEVLGSRNIVIGGQGEADFCSKAVPPAVVKHLHYVAGQCGYFVGRLTRPVDGYQHLAITTHDGSYVIHWHRDELLRITTAEGRDCWRADNPGLRNWSGEATA
jgi:hypothetical protein